MSHVFPPPPAPALLVTGLNALFPVHRIYCVGRNYAAHVREMGGDPTREAPFFFQKPADAVVSQGGATPYPSRTRNLHHEVELVVAIGRAGRQIAASEAHRLIYGYAVGNDLTRRDLQLAAKEAGRPWDTGKAFDASAPVGLLHPVEQTGYLQSGTIRLCVNGQERQRADLSQMIWSVAEVIAELSTYYDLVPGDLVFTGTPEGVGVLSIGDVVEASIEGLSSLSHRITAS